MAVICLLFAVITLIMKPTHFEGVNLWRSAGYIASFFSALSSIASILIVNSANNYVVMSLLFGGWGITPLVFGIIHLWRKKNHSSSSTSSIQLEEVKNTSEIKTREIIINEDTFSSIEKEHFQENLSKATVYLRKLGQRVLDMTEEEKNQFLEKKRKDKNRMDAACTRCISRFETAFGMLLYRGVEGLSDSEKEIVSYIFSTEFN